VIIKVPSLPSREVTKRQRAESSSSQLESEDNSGATLKVLETLGRGEACFSQSVSMCEHAPSSSSQVIARIAKFV